MGHFGRESWSGRVSLCGGRSFSSLDAETLGRGWGTTAAQREQCTLRHGSRLARRRVTEAGSRLLVIALFFRVWGCL